MILDSSGVS